MLLSRQVQRAEARRQAKAARSATRRQSASKVRAIELIEDGVTRIVLTTRAHRRGH